MKASADRDWPAEFDRTFAQPASAVGERIWRRVFGDEYPEGVEPFSLISVTELHRFATELQVGPGDLLADIGCGRGGPGLWVAAQTGARLLGLDVAENALAAARRRSADVGLTDRADFRLGSFDETGLGDASVDAIMSVDAFLFAPDKGRAAAELARILRPGGRLVLTTWDYRRQPEGRPPQVDDHRPLLAASGFGVLAYEESEEWEARQRAIADGLLAAADELAAEAGEGPDEVRRRAEEMRATLPAILRRVLIVARRR